MAPRNVAPSAIVTVGQTMSPCTDPLGQISTFLLALMFPVTFPSTTISWAKIWVYPGFPKTFGLMQ